MAFNMKTWANPISLDATNLNRIEQGVQNNADILDILQDEVANLQNNQLDITQELATLLNDTPNIVATLTNITNILNNNDLSALLTNTDSFLSKSAQTLSNAEIAQVYKNLGIDKFLKLTSITVDGQSVVNGSKVDITLPKVDTALNIFSNNAISNSAVASKIKSLESSIKNIDVYVPTDLSEFTEDSDHLLVTQQEKDLWNTITDTSKIVNTIEEMLKEYALKDHNHDDVYSKLGHTHAEIIQAIPTDYVTLSTDQTIAGVKTFTAPEYIRATEQATTKFKTSNGGALIIGKEGKNSGTMLRFDQTEGTARLRFRGSNAAGAMIWEQPEQGAQLYFDLGEQGVDYKRILMPRSAGTLALTSQIPTKVSALTNDAGYLTSFTETDPTVPAWAKTAVKPSYTYSEILNTPTIPTNNNQLTNGAGYITESEAGTVVDTKLTTFETNKITPINNSINSLQTKDAQLTSAIATLETSYKSYTDTAIANLVDSAPDTLNTLKKLAGAITMNDSMLDALTEAVANHNHDDTYSKLTHTHSNYVTLTTPQDITGLKTFTNAISLNGGATVVAGKTLTFAGTSNSNTANIKFGTVNNKNPYFGYATDQTDGTFVWSTTGTNYGSGLAIGGNSGNLLWKGTKVAISTDINTLQTNINTVQTNVDTVQTNVDTVQTNVDTVQTKLNNLDSNVVHIDGSETIVGQKTFSQVVTAPTFNATSDRRLKKNIKDFYPIKSILDLPIKEFDYKNTDIHTIGCIAQDLLKICPQIVVKNNGYLAINESKIVYLVLDELKHLKEEFDNLKENYYGK